MAFIDGYKRCTLWSARITLSVGAVVAVAFFVAAFADSAFNLGWGFRWRDCLAAIGYFVFVGIVYFFGKLSFRIIGFGNL